MAKQRFSAAEVIAAIRAGGGIKTAAAKRLGCDVDTLDNYCSRYPMVDAAYRQARAGVVDAAESILLQRLAAGEWDAAKFVLTTLGRDRGWGNSVDVNISVDEIARQLAAEYGGSEERIRAELLDLDTERRRRRTV